MRRTALNDGWRFFRWGADDDATQAAASPELVTLPHDAMIHAPRRADAPSGGEQGNFEGGRYRYERELCLADGSACALVQFGGVYRRAVVSVDGVELARHAYGFSPFFVDLSEALADGRPHLLGVDCDNAAQPDSRFYTGAGIHRPVWLWTGGPSCIEPEGVRVTTLSLEPPRIRVEAAAAPGTLVIEVMDDDEVIAAGTARPIPSTADVDEGQGSGASARPAQPAFAATQALELELPASVEPWSAEHPTLYGWRARLLTSDGSTLDEAAGRFGLRTLSWSTEGFFVNGERTLLRGGCVHADCGILGAAAWPEADRRRVRRLKEAGFNALRSSHNPASDALVEACDELGLYLIDEGWDQWFFHKTAHDFADEWREHHDGDLLSMVARGYNHPSIVMWSIGNEVSEPSVPEGLEAIDEMVALLHAADDTRPVTCGVNLTILGSAAKGRAIYDPEKGGMGEGGDASQSGLTSTTFNALANVVSVGMNHMADLPSFDRACSPALDRLDIAGYNYARGRYAMDAQLHPDRIICGSETLCGDVVKNYRQMLRQPSLIGDFVWAAWDYLGEAGCGAWTYGDPDRAFQKSYPWLLAEQGAFDLLGHPNAEAFLCQAAWGLARERPLIAVRPLGQGVAPSRAAWRFSNAIPSWSWQGCEGERAVVEVFSDAPVVELALNGRVLSRKRPHECICRWHVKYAPGELRARSLTARGELLGESVLVSAGAAHLRLASEQESIRPGGIAFVEVRLADINGIVESNADVELQARVTGGELLAFGSARPRTEERYDNGRHTSYRGYAQAVVRADSCVCTKAVVLEVESACERCRIDIPLARS